MRRLSTKLSHRGCIEIKFPLDITLSRFASVDGWLVLSFPFFTIAEYAAPRRVYASFLKFLWQNGFPFPLLTWFLTVPLVCRLFLLPFLFFFSFFCPERFPSLFLTSSCSVSDSPTFPRIVHRGFPRFFLIFSQHPLPPSRPGVTLTAYKGRDLLHRGVQTRFIDWYRVGREGGEEETNGSEIR